MVYLLYCASFFQQYDKRDQTRTYGSIILELFAEKICEGLDRFSLFRYALAYAERKKDETFKKTG